jgi:TDG/mug DNA glycosylase family protein
MHRELPDYLRSRLRLVFVGINPGKTSAERGHYYARPGNPFWEFLFESGLTARRLYPEDDQLILDFGIGLTDVVKRWSRSSGDLSAQEFRVGATRLADKLKRITPQVVAFNGKVAYEKFSGRAARLGWQEERIAGARVFVLPSTSPRNARMLRVEKLRYFRQLAKWLKGVDTTPSGRGADNRPRPGLPSPGHPGRTEGPRLQWVSARRRRGEALLPRGKLRLALKGQAC